MQFTLETDTTTMATLLGLSFPEVAVEMVPVDIAAVAWEEVTEVVWAAAVSAAVVDVVGRPLVGLSTDA